MTSNHRPRTNLLLLHVSCSQVLIPKLKEPDPNPGVVISVLAAIGEQAQVHDVIRHQSVSSTFPIISGHRNGIEYHSSTLFCPVRPSPLTAHLPYIFYTSLSTWLSVFLSVSFLVLMHLTFFKAYALRHFSSHFSLYSVLFFVTGATFTDSLHVRL